MNKKISALIGIAFFSLGSLTANAAFISLYDYGFNVDGSGTNALDGDAIPGSVDVSGFDLNSGLGQINISFAGIGAHNALTYLDHEIDEELNTWFNENASIGGALGGGQSWEADEPEFVFGDIYTNYMGNALDNSNAVPVGSEDDVSMALGWDFSLAAGQTAVASFFASTSNDSGGSFFIEHNDPDSSAVGANGGASIFFWSDLNIQGGEPPSGLMEPGTLGMTLFGMFSVFGLRRRKMQ
jgi:hypothetical protein